MNAVHRPSGHHHLEPAAAAATRVALYLRGPEPSTLDCQEAALRRFLDTHQPRSRVVAVYRDVAPGAGWRDARPGLRHAVADAARGTYDVLLVQRLDRLSRHAEHVIALVAALDAASVALQCADEPFDSHAVTFGLPLRARAAFADHQRLVVLAHQQNQRGAAHHRRATTATPIALPTGPAVPGAPTRHALTAGPASEVPMSHIIRSIDRGTRTVDGVEVQITEQVWPDEGRSFEVHRTDTGDDLTADGCFDTWPTDDQIAHLLSAVHEFWLCRGCGTTIDASQADLIVDHVRDCDRVDGAAAPIQGGRR